MPIKKIILISTILVVLIITFYIKMEVFASDTGILSPTANGGKFNAGTNPTYGYVADGLYMTLQNNTGDSKSQSYENFGFSIPNNAIITGIMTTVSGYYTTAYIPTVGIFNNTSGTWADMSTGFTKNVMSTTTQGDANNLWGKIWVPTDFSNANFSARFSLNPYWDNMWNYFDQIQVTIYYTILPAVKVSSGILQIKSGSLIIK